ncbi:hypothetical protein VT84_15630 [Gemmata sp. SH-PL17]|uniref:hypothetical protein n=1 Tax=Gemmata sp. SH-PL17 TaxID=1630693 RepID=UPI00078D7E0B|nr:hypothetical protein [Gemmata sp. SH-PL17]AMV25828.1 hypothetical protein VT84_15630 [Gemmata sp. SH-PL17]
MALSPKAGGVVGVALGAAILLYNAHSLRTEGVVYPGLLAIGVGVLPSSLGLAVLPARRMMIPTETGNGRAVYDSQNPKWTTLGGALLGFGIAAGLGLYAYLKVGF